MEKLKTSPIVKIFVLITFIAMVAVNAMANILPINGMNTGEISDSYGNLFAPAGLTFAIWGLIYLLLAIYTIYQLAIFQKDKINIKNELFRKVGVFFIISSLANLIWIFSWHYLIIPLSMVLMIVILLCLIFIMQLINAEKLTLKEKIFLRLPFSVYFGWITVATIANATTLFVSLKWNRFGINETIWTIIILFTGMLIGSATTIRNKDIAYGLVIIWAYIGILIKHMSSIGFSSQYPSVINSVIICIVLLLFALVFVLIPKKPAFSAAS